MSLIDKMRAKQQTIQGDLPVPAQQATVTVPEKRAKQPVASTEGVTCKCGHIEHLELFEDGKDKFRDQRRKKLAGRDCPACRQAAAQARQEAANKNRKPPRPEYRLPHGSTFEVSYNAVAKQWSGCLMVSLEEEHAVKIGTATVTFSEKAGGVFRLLTLLDCHYRRWLGANWQTLGLAEKPLANDGKGG